MKRVYIVLIGLLFFCMIFGACSPTTKENIKENTIKENITDKENVNENTVKEIITSKENIKENTIKENITEGNTAKENTTEGNTAKVNTTEETSIDNNYSMPVVDAITNKSDSFASDTISELPMHYSKGFKIKYLDNGCKLVTDGENYKILLVPRGKSAPKDIFANKTVYIPLRSVMTGSSTFVGAMNKLNVLDSLKAVTTSKDFWYIPKVKEMVNNREIQYVGGDNMEQPNYEIVKSINPELVFVYTGTTGQQPLMKKLSELGINYAVDNEYLESNCLGRLEWIKFIAAFYDKEDEAEKIFNDVVKNVNAVTAKVSGLSKPKVAWGLSWAGKIYVASPNSYVGKWIDMCQGDYVFKNMSVGTDTQVNAESFYAEAKDADVFIFSSTTNYMASATINQIIKENPLFENIKAVKNGNVWAYAPDWWQTIPETDVFVKDIAAVFHPEAFGGYTPVKLVKLPRN